MVDLRDLEREVPEGRMIWFGTVAKTATDITDLVPVILPDYDPELEWGPCRWQSRDAVTLPQRGDACLVIIDNRHAPWIVAWWPF